MILKYFSPSTNELLKSTLNTSTTMKWIKKDCQHEYTRQNKDGIMRSDSVGIEAIATC